jgi:hypothetical protein
MCHRAVYGLAVCLALPCYRFAVNRMAVLRRMMERPAILGARCIAREGGILSNLNAVLPKSQLVERFGKELILEEYGRDDLVSITRQKPESMHGIGASVWNRIVNRRWYPVDPRVFSKQFDEHDPRLPQAISRLLGTKVIRDIYYVKGWKGTKTDSALVVELLVALVYRNDLYLADVTFVNPDQPISEGQGFAFQTHKGLGLLPTLLANMQKKAEELGCEQLTLQAATRDQMNLFSKHGFAVEDSPLGRVGLESGVAIPMERDVLKPVPH